ncbi:MAG: tRNA uridine-5-carboxymethylaminomethyl(34) synthesis GTPase MnmE [Gammaproteobacteria bacterium]
MLCDADTIAAIATPPGNGGVGIIRVSGQKVVAIAERIVGKLPKPRYAHFTAFLDADGTSIDSGIALYFPAPASYTGEDILELQAHGGSVLLDMLLKRVLGLGVRPARPGEFTERAFLNNKLDLAQAEAVADLIDASTEQAVRSAQNSMQGVFSSQINSLVEELSELRTYVEAGIDFSDEEIDLLADGVVADRIVALEQCIDGVLQIARQGRLLRDGMNVVLAGRPNAGKSSLLNALAGHSAAIVTAVAGTTRDVLRECIQIDGMPLHIIDTAGLHDSANIVEQEGMRRAREEIVKADRVLLLIDSVAPESHDELLKMLPQMHNVTKIYNKIDLTGEPPQILESESSAEIHLSVKTGDGLELLKQHLKHTMGYNEDAGSVFIARRRHLEALSQARGFIRSALQQLKGDPADELIAEDLRQAQMNLAEITGQFTSEDLLGRIFSSFCIGK